MGSAELQTRDRCQVWVATEKQPNEEDCPEPEDAGGSCRGQAASLKDILKCVLLRCLCHCRRWAQPARYSAADWWEETRSIGKSAAWEALLSFDPARQIPLAVFARSRIMAQLLTFYRREWRFSMRNAPLRLRQFSEESSDEEEFVLEPRTEEYPQRQMLREVMAQLPAPQSQLLERLFWYGESEEELARSLKLSQRAVSKRKKAAIKQLRLLLKKETSRF
jgi:RNA polymerase sigma factor (sigma-70 family)